MSIASRYPPPARLGQAAGWADRHGRVVYGLIGVVGFLLFWEFGSRAGIISEYFFSRPTGIIEAGIKEVQLERFWVDVRTSVTEFLTGYLLAIALGVPIGLLIGWYKRLQYIFDPWLNFLNSLPRFALMPVIVIAFGLGILSKTAVVFLGAFFAIVIPRRGELVRGLEATAVRHGRCAGDGAVHRHRAATRHRPGAHRRGDR
jgi:NitT/TauT family transport system permease protein